MSPLQVSHMTQTPGTPAYMLPDVMVEKPKHDTSIDIFSYGVLMTHVFSGRWPIPQIGPVRTEADKLIPVSEAERREVFLKVIGDDHPLMDLILKDDLLYIISTGGDWWLAYSQDTNRKGYIPGNYVAELTYPIHASVYDYESRTDEDLSFKKGDLLCIINTDDVNWWFARSKVSEKEGYVPSNY